MNNLFESLESRVLCSAVPTISDIRAEPIFPVTYQAFRLSAQAADDVGVRAVTFFMDRNSNNRWDAGVDQPLGEDFIADSDGRHSIIVAPDGTWPDYPYPRILADAVDTEGQWAATLAVNTGLATVGLPVVSSFYANIIIYSEGQSQPFQGISLSAKVDEPLGYPQGGVSATFFLDKNSNGSFDNGIDQDLGAATGGADGRGYVSRYTTVTGTSLNGQLMAVAYRSSGYGERFGTPVSATTVTSGFSSGVTPPVITGGIWQNVAEPSRSGVEIGQRMKITVVADAPVDYLYQNRLRAVTLFFDANFDHRWTPGVDTHIGEYFFGADTIRGVANIEFTVTPQMGFDRRPFVVAAVDNYQWGPTFTFWPKLISRPWTENLQPAQPSFSVGSSVVATFIARDDSAVRSVFTWLDKNNDGLFNVGEAYQQTAVRLSGFGNNTTWRTTINTAGLNYTPGSYRLMTIADDFQNARQTAASLGNIILT